MITLRDTVEVAADPAAVFQWLVHHLSDTEAYRAWHPDHVAISWLAGTALQEGGIVRADEYLHGVLHRLTFRVVKVVPNRRIEYRPLYPLALLAPGNTFEIEAKGKGRCTFTATGRLRLPRWLFEQFARRHQGKIAATLQHMKEEGLNLKQALESRT